MFTDVTITSFFKARTDKNKRKKAESPHERLLTTKQYPRARRGKAATGGTAVAKLGAYMYTNMLAGKHVVVSMQQH